MPPRRPDLAEIGEGFSGDGADAAHINTVLGLRDGPLLSAWATALATPRQGHIPFLAVVRPNLAVKPPTLFVNKAPFSGERHERLTWGAAQAGVAGGVLDAVAGGTIDPQRVDELLLITAVWVDPEAVDEQAVYANNRLATAGALRAGKARAPDLDQLLAVAAAPHNPFFGGPANPS